MRAKWKKVETQFLAKKILKDKLKKTNIFKKVKKPNLSLTRLACEYERFSCNIRVTMSKVNWIKQ
jgi:hypothetical protein